MLMLKKRQREKNMQKLIIAGAILLVVGIFVVPKLIKNGRSSTTVIEHAETVFNNSKDSSVSQVVDHLEWRHEEYKPISWGNVQRGNPSSGYFYLVTHKYKHREKGEKWQNESKVFYLSKNGKIVSEKDYDL